MYHSQPLTVRQTLARVLTVLLICAGTGLSLVIFLSPLLNLMEGTYSLGQFGIDLLLFVIGVILFVSGILWNMTLTKEYRLRYLFSKKDFEARIAPLEALYAADAEEQKYLRKYLRKQYNRTGTLFPSADVNCWILTEKNGLAAAEGITDALLSCCRDGSGVRGFFEINRQNRLTDQGLLSPEEAAALVAAMEIEEAEEAEWGLQRKHRTIRPLDPYEIREAFHCDLFPSALYYLMDRLWIITNGDYYFADEDLAFIPDCESESPWETVDKVFSPALFMYEGDLVAALEKIRACKAREAAKGGTGR